MGRTTLVVDDDPAMRRLVCHFLHQQGYETMIAADGREALAIIREHGPRLVIADWSMPHMCGTDLCRALRDDKSVEFVYVILLTAHAEKDLLVEAFGAGADDYITKPFHREELLARVRAGERVLSHEEETARRAEAESERNHLRRAVCAMEHVIGVVGHEMRTPLAGLRAMSDFLLSDGARETADYNRFVSEINRELVRMSNTVNALLEAARLSSGSATWNWSTVTLAEVVGRAVERVGEPFELNAGVLGANVVQGAGLGLVICTGIAAAHGGGLRIESEAGKGTTVRVNLGADLNGPVEDNRIGKVEALS